MRNDPPRPDLPDDHPINIAYAEGRSARILFEQDQPYRPCPYRPTECEPGEVPWDSLRKHWFDGWQDYQCDG